MGYYEDTEKFYNNFKRTYISDEQLTKITAFVAMQIMANCSQTVRYSLTGGEYKFSKEQCLDYIDEYLRDIDIRYSFDILSFFFKNFLEEIIERLDGLEGKSIAELFEIVTKGKYMFYSCIFGYYEIGVRIAEIIIQYPECIYACTHMG